MRNALTGLALAVAMATPLAAQEYDIIGRDLYEDRLRTTGNSITFCYNPIGMMTAFEQELAQLLGSALLAEVRLQTVLTGDIQVMPTEFDYRIPLGIDQIFLLMVEHCDAFMGFLVNNRNPEWLMTTRPYMTARTVLFTAEDGVARIDDLDDDLRIGVRMMAPGDAQLINYLAARSGGAEWTRVPYHDNRLVIDRVLDGTNDVGMIWEPGFYYATRPEGGLGALHLIDEMPFETRMIEVGIATRAQDRYLNTLLSDAIAALEAEGAIAALMAAHHLAPAGTN